MTTLLPTLAAGDSHSVTVLLLSLALLLGMARLLGEWSRRLGQPSILGELLAGILLGPTLFGAIAPDAYAWLFPSMESIDALMEAGRVAEAESARTSYEILKGLITLSAVFLLLVAGLEVELSVALKQGKTAIMVAMLGMALPFTAAALVSGFAPELMGGIGAIFDPENPDAKLRIAFAVFVGIALSITALPVIAKVLIDLNIFKADLGMLIMSAAILNDVVGWMAFAVVMAMLVPAGDGANPGMQIGMTIALTVGFIIVCLTIGRVLVHRTLPFIQAYGSWPGSVIGFVLVVTLLCAAATEAIGIHAIFGAFIAGVAVGDSHHLRERTREVIHEFITSIFAPIFFASIGLYVNFITAFNPVTVLIVVIIAFSGKMSGCYLAGRLCRMQKRDSLAVGFGMVAQGTMGVILGQLALDLDLITNELFVGIVIVALLTSLAAGPGMQRVLRRKQAQILGDMLSDKHFVSWLKGSDAQQVISELSGVAAEHTEIKQADIYQAVWRREQIMRTGLPGGLAVPHARLGGIKKPIIVIGRSRFGVDFDAADGRPTRIVCLLLTPLFDQAAQVQLLRLVAEAFNHPDRRAKALGAEGFTEFLAAIKLPGEPTREAEAEDDLEPKPADKLPQAKEEPSAET